MTKYLDKSFSVHPGLSKSYRDNYDAAFGAKTTETLPDWRPTGSVDRMELVRPGYRLLVSSAAGDVASVFLSTSCPCTWPADTKFIGYTKKPYGVATRDLNALGEKISTMLEDMMLRTVEEKGISYWGEKMTQAVVSLLTQVQVDLKVLSERRAPQGILESHG